MNEYALIKIVHLGALIFWLGPPLGAWIVFKIIGSTHYPQNAVQLKISKVFFATIVLEHVAFVVLVATGAALALKFNMWGMKWLDHKITIIVLFILPLEILDIYLGNWVAWQAFKGLSPGEPVEGRYKTLLDWYHGPFTKLALFVIPISVLIVMYLAISKNTLWSF